MSKSKSSLQFFCKSSQRDMTLVMSTTPSIGSMGWMSVGWVCCGTLPYLGFAISSLFTGVGSFLGFAGTPHFLGSEVELGPALLPWIDALCSCYPLQTLMQAELSLTSLPRKYGRVPQHTFRVLQLFVYMQQVCTDDAIN